MHIASCALFEDPPPDYRDLVDLFASKVALVPRYRQRARFVPMDLGRPVWVDDSNFDLEYHLRHTALPPPGEEDDLQCLMGRLMSQELDRSRPLWEEWIVEGLEGDRWAIISKVHHCMVDGVAGVDLISVVLDATPDRAPTDPDHWNPEPEPSSLRLAVDAVANLVTSPREQLQAVGAAAVSPRIPDNRVSAIFFDLPVQVGDPLERLTAVREEMGRLKQSHEPEAGQALTALVATIPPALAAQTTRLAARLLTRVQQRSMNTVTTNVPGPLQPLYAAGREMIEYLPFVPLGPGVLIGVAILSYNGRLAFGVTGDFDTATDISVVADGIEAEIATLMALATAPMKPVDQSS